MGPNQGDRNSTTPSTDGCPVSPEKGRGQGSPVSNGIDLSKETLPPPPTKTEKTGSTHEQEATKTPGAKKADPAGREANDTLAKKTEEVREPLLAPSLVLKAFRESTQIYASTLENSIKKLGLSAPVVTFGKVALATGVLVNLAVNPVMTLGILGTAAGFAAVTLRNDHGRAQSMVGGVLSIAHLALMGDFAATISNVVGNVRTLVQSMIPESRVGARIASAIVGASVSIGVFSMLTNVAPLPRVENMPMVASTFFSIATAFTVNYTTMTRVCNLAGGAAFLPYFLSQTNVSVPAVISVLGFMMINSYKILTAGKSNTSAKEASASCLDGKVVVAQGG